MSATGGWRRARAGALGLLRCERRPRKGGALLRVYRLQYRTASRHAPPLLWEWEQPYISHLLVSARTFGHPVV